MSYNILFIRHSAEGVIGNTNTTTQYDGPMVAARAIPGGHFVCISAALPALAPPGLPLSASGATPPGVETGAGTQSRVHGQLAPPVNSSRASSLPPAAAAHQPGRGSSLRAMVGTKLCPWLRARSTVSSNASFNTIRIAVPPPSWPRFTKCWHRPEPTTSSH
jgi:hypothetical protein